MNKDKALSDILAVHNMAENEQLTLLLKRLPNNPGAGDVLSGMVVRTLLGSVSPGLLRKLDGIGLGPGQSASRLQSLRAAGIPVISYDAKGRKVG